MKKDFLHIIKLWTQEKRNYNFKSSQFKSLARLKGVKNFDTLKVNTIWKQKKKKKKKMRKETKIKVNKNHSY